MFSTGAQPAPRVFSEMLSCALCWLPGTHKLLLLGEGRLARFDAAASPPLVQLLVETAMPIVFGQACMAADPRGEVAVVLSTRALPDSELLEATLTVFSCASLVQLSSTTFQLDSPCTPQAQYETSDSLQVSMRAIAACCQGVGTRVFALVDGRLVDSFWVPGLRSPRFSPDGVFLCGLRERTHVVIDARTGSELFQLPSLIFDSAQSPAQAVSIAWAGHNQLHAGFSGGEKDPDSLEDTVCLWSILTF